VVLLAQALSRTFAPALIDAVVTLLGIFTDLARPNGPLVAMVKALAAMLEAFRWIINNVPGAKLAVEGLATAMAVVATVKFLGAITGIAKMVELFKALRTAALGAAVAETAANAVGGTKVGGLNVVGPGSAKPAGAGPSTGPLAGSVVTLLGAWRARTSSLASWTRTSVR